MWPISDAGLGATAYTFEMLMAWMACFNVAGSASVAFWTYSALPMMPLIKLDRS